MKKIYKETFDSISASDEFKENVKNGFAKKSIQKKRASRPKLPVWKKASLLSATAALLCICIVVTAVLTSGGGPGGNQFGSVITNPNKGKQHTAQLFATDNLLTEFDRIVTEGMVADETFRDAINKLSFQLTSALYEDGKNNLVSPMSIIFALTMVENGAKGETLAQMEALTGLPVLTLSAYLRGYSDALMLANTEDVSMNIANSVWFRRGEIDPKPEFLQACIDYFEAGIYSSAFDADTVKAVNDWVKTNTNGMIDKIIDNFSGDTVMLLMNAVAFEGKWQTEFNSEGTQEQTFRNADGTLSDVPFMNGSADRYIGIEGGTGIVKYYDSSYAFAAILPDGDTSISELMATISSKGFHNILGFEHDKITVSIPKFSYDFETGKTISALQGLGMTDAFGGGANFNGIAGGLYISNIIHKTHIEFDESGTKAAAVTAIIGTITSVSPAKTSYHVTFDRPFVYAIYDTVTGIPVFIGVVNTMQA